MIKRILIIDDEYAISGMVKKFLAGSGYSVEIATDAEDGLARSLSRDFDLVISDLAMPNIDGIEILRQLKTAKPNQAFIMITAYGTIERAFEASQLGADYFLKKPFELEELRICIEKIIATMELKKEISALKSMNCGDTSLAEIIGVSPEMALVKKQIQEMSRFDTSILITGENGTGKELAAKAIHSHSQRRMKPFIPLNCSAIPETLLESEFFGYNKGTFTGAFSDKPGLFEVADTGTLFLDEIGDLPLAMQPKILRVIQEKKVRRLGDVREIPVDVKLICATSRDLQALIRENRFREDLYYRINVINICLPPLRKRSVDIPVLVRHFIRKITQKLGLPEKGMDPEALSFIEKMPFPGNVRELENIMERLIVLSPGKNVTWADLDAAVITNLSDTPPVLKTPDFSIPYKEALERMRISFDRQYIVNAMLKHKNNHKRTAEYLGISLRLLQYKLKEMREYYKDSPWDQSDMSLIAR